jgi:hypothetical protein
VRGDEPMLGQPRRCVLQREGQSAVIHMFSMDIAEGVCGVSWTESLYGQLSEVVESVECGQKIG